MGTPNISLILFIVNSLLTTFLAVPVDLEENIKIYLSLEVELH